MPLTPAPFRSSQRLYAIDPASFRVRRDPLNVQHRTGFPLYSLTVDAIWFKKSKGVVAVHIGHLSHFTGSDHVPTLDDLIEQYNSARYGGSILALWDGSRFWSNDIKDRDEQDALIERLNPILDNYPDVPEGWMGWYKLTEPHQFRS